MRLLPLVWRRYFLQVELGLSVVLTLGFVLWVERYHGLHIVTQILGGNRAAVYGALASIFGALLGFVITTVSIVIGFSTNERLAVVRESRQYNTLWDVFKSTTRVLGFATAAALVGLLMDRDNNPMRLVLYLVVFTVILSILRIARCIWVLENIIALVTSPSKARVGGSA